MICVHIFNIIKLSFSHMWEILPFICKLNISFDPHEHIPSHAILFCIPTTTTWKSVFNFIQNKNIYVNLICILMLSNDTWDIPRYFLNTLFEHCLGKSRKIVIIQMTMEVRLSTNALTGDTDLNLWVFNFLIAIVRSMQVPVNYQVPVGPQGLESTYKYSWY